MMPAARSVFPEIALKRVVTVTSPYTVGLSAIAGNSASAVWHSAFGLLGASDSARTAHEPENTSAPFGAAPTDSASKLHDAASAVEGGLVNFTAGVPSHAVSVIVSTSASTAANRSMRATSCR